MHTFPLLSDPFLDFDLADHLFICHEWELEWGTKTSFQIFIKTPDGKSFLLRVQALESFNHLKKNIFHIMGILVPLQSLICEGKSMQDELRFKITTFFRHPPSY